ncbi:hypothetical protein CBS14141_004162 [Malassezia furfur]|nr:hypothetical protein CBS14141_004162 [Malassezia furfur]
MPLSLTLSLATLCIAYLYPLYATYKVLTAVQRNGSTVNAYSWYGAAKQKQEQDASAPDRPTELAELETLGMYWAVMAVVRVAEAWAEWSWRWIPCYQHAKLVFVLWLVLPQTKYLAPFLASHQDDIDHFVDRATERALAITRATLGVVYNIVRGEAGSWATKGPDERPARPLPRVPEPAEGEEAAEASATADPGAWDHVGHMLHTGVPYVASTGAHALRWLSENALQTEEATRQAATKTAGRVRRRGATSKHAEGA